MLIHEDYDTATRKSEEFKIPEKIEDICFSYDGGRVSVIINGKEVYRATSGTRDFSIEILKD